MEEFYLGLRSVLGRKRIMLSIAIHTFLIFEVVWMFPLKFEITKLNVVMTYAYFMIGLILHVLYGNKKVIVIHYSTD